MRADSWEIELDLITFLLATSSRLRTTWFYSDFVESEVTYEANGETVDKAETDY